MNATTLILVLLCCTSGPPEQAPIDLPALTSPVRPGPVTLRQAKVQSARDPWFGEDKLRHLAVSFGVTGYAHAGLRSLDAEPGTALAASAAVSLAAGIVKELYDRSRGGGFSGRDLVWDLAGTALAMLALDHTR